MSYMSEITAETPVAGMLEEVIENLKFAIDVFNQARKEAEEGNSKQAAEAAGYAKEIFRASQQLVTETHKVERLRQQLGVLDPKRELDFDAARSEVGRRLARLRGAGGLG